MTLLNRTTQLIVALGIVLAASTANAVPIAPGEVISGPELAGPEVGGGTQVAFLRGRFNFTGRFSGQFSSTVIEGDTNNPLGGLTFLYQFTNDESSAVPIATFDIGAFRRRTLNVSYAADPELIAPAMASRHPSGVGISFDYSPSGSNPEAGFLAPGESSTTLYIRTAVTEYKRTRTAGFGDGSGWGVGIQVYTPVVPEPSSFALLALGAVGIFGVCRRTFKGKVRDEADE